MAHAEPFPQFLSIWRLNWVTVIPTHPNWPFPLRRAFYGSQAVRFFSLVGSPARCLLWLQHSFTAWWHSNRPVMSCCLVYRIAWLQPAERIIIWALNAQKALCCRRNKEKGNKTFSLKHVGSSNVFSTCYSFGYLFCFGFSSSIPFLLVPLFLFSVGGCHRLWIYAFLKLQLPLSMCLFL